MNHSISIHPKIILHCRAYLVHLVIVTINSNNSSDMPLAITGMQRYVLNNEDVSG